MATMTGKERLNETLNFRQPAGVCVDLGGTSVSGIHVGTLSKLRQRILGEKDYRVKVTEPYQMLGEVDDKLLEALGIDVVGLPSPKTMFGFENRDWKPFTMFDGTEVLVPGDFNVTTDEDGGLSIYPEGDTLVSASGRMPSGGFFFDSIVRQEPIDDDKLDPADNLEEFALLSDEYIQYYVDTADKLADGNDRGIVISLPGTGIGDIALVPAPFLKHPRGIRDIQEWYISTAIRQDYLHEVFSRQTDIAVENIIRLGKAIGDCVQVAFVCGTDFGTQRSQFISTESYRELYSPYYKRINTAIHENTNWKTFKHSCGSIFDLIPDFIADGFDILNPVQCSAENMNPADLKREYGRDIVFWGGGVDTQKTLPFGTPEEVYDQVRERIGIFNDGGGFVFNPIHNIQANTPIENILATFRAVQDAGKN